MIDSLRRWEQNIGELPMPSPLVWSALIAAFLGFGILTGRVTGSNSLASLTASRTPLKLLVASAPAVSPPRVTSSAKPPPLPEAETTPEPSKTPASSPTSAKQAASGGSTSSSGSPKSSKESSSGSEESSSQGPKAKLPAIKHVFVVMLSDEPYSTAFGPASPAHYLSGTLEKQGQLLVRYYAVAHEELANGIALLSGQGPTQATAANCPAYTDIAPASTATNGQVLGKGCVYPASTNTLMGQLTSKHLTWKAYVEGIDEGAAPPACAHPASGAADVSAAPASGQSGAPASGQAAAPASGQAIAPSYQTWRNPFVYFHSITGSSACVANDLGMSALKGDLASEKRSASFSYIAPGPCDDGSPTPCAPGKASGMMAADAFLKKIVPKILSSTAYKKDGLLAITVDNAPSSGEYADSSSCCSQPRFPNLPAPTGTAALSPQAGGQVGMLLLSPFVKGGGLVQDTYNHFSLLATIEQTFGLSRLGYAGLSEVKPLSPSLFSGG
jgi:phosphatidylinositol-3-phosphatase